MSKQSDKQTGEARADSLHAMVGRAQLVPTEIAVCPECGGPIKWWCPDDTWCFCEGSNHAPEQSVEMINKWNAVEATVKAWLDKRPSNS